jgi:hypothetical protein
MNGDAIPPVVAINPATVAARRKYTTSDAGKMAFWGVHKYAMILMNAVILARINIGKLTINN